MPQYLLHGAITGLQNQPVPGLTISAFVRHPAFPERQVGEPAVTNIAGRYTLLLTEEHLHIIGVPSQGQEVFIRAYDDGQLLGESNRVRLLSEKIEINLKVEYTVATESYTCLLYTSPSPRD